MTVEIHGICMYNSFTKLIHVSLYVMTETNLNDFFNLEWQSFNTLKQFL